jgi:type IV pilus biogenesis protein CpaD/CtpE
MEVLYPRCGLDVHAASVIACARIAIGAQVTYEHHANHDARAARVGRVAHRARVYACGHGSHRRLLEPVWHVLEEHFTRDARAT